MSGDGPWEFEAVGRRFRSRSGTDDARNSELLPQVILRTWSALRSVLLRACRDRSDVLLKYIRRRRGGMYGSASRPSRSRSCSVYYSISTYSIPCDGRMRDARCTVEIYVRAAVPKFVPRWVRPASNGIGF